MPAMPVAGLPLSESFDALAARARGGDASASMRLLRDMRRCQQREMLATILSLPELRPAQEDELPPELRETRNARLAEQKRVRDEAQKKLAASEALCDGVTPAELATLGEWLERAADSGDPGAAFCYVIAATSDGYAPSDRYSDEWVAWMQRYRSKAYAYSERAFEAGYAMASLYLYDVAAGPYISTPAFPLDPDLPADLERAYGFALLHLDLIDVEGGAEGYVFAAADGRRSVNTTFEWKPECAYLGDQEEATYTFTFNVMDDRCYSQLGDTVTVNVNLRDVDRADEDFLPPNVITPNGDNRNDFFAMVREDPATHELISILPVDNCQGHFERIFIVNRWGSEVYSSSDRDFRWYADNQAAGVYFYTLKYSDRDYKGTVSVAYFEGQAVKN